MPTVESVHVPVAMPDFSVRGWGKKKKKKKRKEILFTVELGKEEENGL